MDKYMPKVKPQASGLGNPQAEIMILIDHPDPAGLKQGRVLDGPAETVLREALHRCGLVMSDVYVEAVVKDDTRHFVWWDGKKKIPKQDVSQVRERVRQLMHTSPARIFMPMGDLAHYIVNDRKSLAADRGYLFRSTLVETKWSIPIQDVKMMIWSNYIWRYYLSSDLDKAKTLISKPEIDWEPRKTYELKTFQEVHRVLSKLWEIGHQGIEISVDIEVSNFEVSHIGFSADPMVGYSLHFDNTRWTPQEEVEIWKMVARILSDEQIKKVGQNFIFDSHFLAYRNNIFVRNCSGDTMIGHSVMYPDFLKGLGFLGSIYINVPVWKDKVKFKNIKKEA